MLVLAATCLRTRAETVVDPHLSPGDAALVNDQPIPKHLVEVFLKNDREGLGLTGKTDAERAQLASLPATILDELIDL